MGLSKSDFKDRDIFIDYDFEDVMFRYEYQTRRFFRKFYGKTEETEVSYDNRLLNDAMLFGEETDVQSYHVGKQKHSG